jgi:hypothetical protein
MAPWERGVEAIHQQVEGALHDTADGQFVPTPNGAWLRSTFVLLVCAPLGALADQARKRLDTNVD